MLRSLSVIFWVIKLGELFGNYYQFFDLRLHFTFFFKVKLTSKIAIVVLVLISFLVPPFIGLVIRSIIACAFMIDSQMPAVSRR